MVEPHGPGKVDALDGSVSVTIGIAVAIVMKRRVPDATLRALPAVSSFFTERSVKPSS